MSGKTLVVVESPSKAKTISKYLGKGYDVRASVGHVKDLPKSQMGVDIEHEFEPQYETIRGKGKVLQEIRKAARKADMIYLAPDPDREGEAIAWHIASELNVAPEKVRRVLFNEITKKAILAALEEPRELNANRFNSQQARRILDRLVGYQISPLLWDKVRRGLSAGRVQSVAVRIVVERERLIQAFVAEEYWTVTATLDGAQPPQVVARFQRTGDGKATPRLPEGAVAKAIVADATGHAFTVHEVQKRNRKQSPPAPFTTSRLQQEAARAFRYTAKRTMNVAQRLYEGVELGAEGAVGLITYMRTDSTRLSDDAVAACRQYVTDKWGAEFLPAKPNVYQTKGRAQDAHEAIRPTSLDYPPAMVKPFLEAEAYKLYSLIWKRFVGCQMRPAVFAMTRIDIKSEGGHIFRATGSVKTFDGYTAVYQETRGDDDEDEDAGTLPALEEGDVLTAASVDAKQHFTQPPPRFTEATLVRELEEKGIGRPSTYASIISTIQDKGYAAKEKSRFSPTELGTIVNGLLVESFPNLFDVGFTARMEDELDAIEDGRVEWRELLKTFWSGLSVTLETARTEMRNIKREETPTDLECPTDDAPLVIKFGRNGSFLACSNYPDCKFTGELERDADGKVSIKGADTVGRTCGTCNEGDLIYKSGRYGRFIGCSRYPDCRHTEPVPTGVRCPRCDKGDLIEKQSRRGKVFFSCSTYPTCDYAQWDRPIPTPCPLCANPYVNERSSRRKADAEGLVCPSCKQDLPQDAAT